jgi:hypothetical protein
MPTKVIKKGQILAPIDNGQLITYMALTKQSSYEIEGESLTNKVYLATDKPLWNPKTSVKADVRINGVVSGCAVSGGSSNDNLEVEAGVVNVNGTQVNLSADTSNAVTRGAASKYTVHALCVDNSGTLSVVAGTDGDSLDLTGGFDGAGQKPLVATTLAVIAYAVTYGDTAAPIDSEHIYAGESANIAYRIDHVRGGIVLFDALEANHTGSIPRGVYAQFYYLGGSSLQQIGKIESASLTIRKAAPTPTPNMDTCWEEHAPMPQLGWSCSINKWRETQFWVDAVLNPDYDYVILKLYEDSADSHYFTGKAILNGDYNMDIKRGAVSEALQFMGDGELVATGI